jgi:hypothetical protein
VGTINAGTFAEGLLQAGLDAVFSGHWFQRNPGLVFAFAEELSVNIKMAHQMAWPFAGSARAKKS